MPLPTTAAAMPRSVIIMRIAWPSPGGSQLLRLTTVTNAVKRAAGTTVTVRGAHAPREVRVRVEDTDGQRRPRVTGSGRGLIGLRERLAVYGGALSAGSCPHGGFAVEAVIPVEVG